jgi:dTDP-4-amino-4,6-dideoxygalactose transaminase
MQVPLLDLKRQYKNIKPEIDAAIQRVVESQRFILGHEVEHLEREIAAYCGVKHAIGVASGTDALLLSLKAAGVGPGDQVITTPFTFFATAGAIVNVGAQPVFVDIDPDIYNIASDQLEDVAQGLTDGQPRAIIPVHLYGQMADMDAVMEIAKRYDSIVIEDAAQAIGAEYKGRKAGTIGHLGCFSFFPSKNLGGYGDGGMVVTNDDELANQMRTLRVHGSRPKYYHSLVGYNSRLDALQATILRAKLPYLDTWSAQRRRVATRYGELLSDVPEIVPPVTRPDQSHIYHQFTIRVRDGSRDALRDHLKQAEIGTAVYYPLSLHLQGCFDDLGYRHGDFPEAEIASQQVLSLPVFPELTASEQEYVTGEIKSFFRT